MRIETALVHARQAIRSVREWVSFCQSGLRLAGGALASLDSTLGERRYFIAAPSLTASFLVQTWVEALTLTK